MGAWGTTQAQGAWGTTHGGNATYTLSKMRIELGEDAQCELWHHVYNSMNRFALKNFKLSYKHGTTIHTARLLRALFSF